MEAAREMGRIVATLHKNDVVHGDLTTSNILRRHTGEYVVIDFGLSSVSKLDEDMAVDLYVLERALISTHIGAAEMFDELLRVYRQVGGDFTASVITRLNDVRARGRKKTMLG
ncbi:TKL family protein kinase [Salpingoeca rosetta]|uniref:non-specific serine/threonine protein kinase n=1 Tax=Salpingoeca rosetta (strain ATCC 50818 / BSB-021) TaxID=946362 RepID=F2UJ18_SALR5|nr:TKL family protein kinase [Salpingoeca rosetta]EGD76966.1 TKL family protein kinase [Salpingoeca rosetta]|eukprot:XP_004990806.1 TKL family protein kinase [Salpingoeca rosetta]